MLLPAGVCARVSLEVTTFDTAASLGSGDVDVLATPRLVALCEQATIEAITSHLPAGFTSVGYRIEITHLVPVMVGSTVTAMACHERTEGKRVTFSVSVTDKCGLVAAGRITRVMVDQRNFMERAR